MTGSIDTSAAVTQVSQDAGREKVRVMVIGSPDGVDSIVKSLCKLRFTEMREWSNPLPTGRSSEVTRILTKIILWEADNV